VSDGEKVAVLTRRIDDVCAAADGVLEGRGAGLSEGAWNARCEELATAVERARTDADVAGPPRIGGGGPADLDELERVAQARIGRVDVSSELLLSIAAELRSGRALALARAAVARGDLVREDLAVQFAQAGVLRSYIVEEGGHRWAVAELSGGGNTAMARVDVKINAPDVDKAARAHAEAEAAQRFLAGEDFGDVIGDAALVFAGARRDRKGG